MEGNRPRRLSMKTHKPNWKEKLRENCFKRVREDRTRLLWKIRLPADPSLNQKEIMQSTFRDIVSNELKKIKNSTSNNFLEISTSAEKVDDDALWEYDGLHMTSQPTESECEEILIEMQRMFYEDLGAEQIRREQDDYERIWEEEEDDYLAQTTFEHLQLNDDQVCKEVVWCPLCKRGELQENHHLIYCNCCKLQLDRGDEVNLDIMRAHLGEAHSEHLDRGCRLTPKFCMETRFNLTALYIQCEACNTFEIVL